MNYQDIIKALPKDVADTLQSELDNVVITDAMSKDEVFDLVDEAVKLTRLQIVIADDEKRRLVDTLLAFVASSIVAVVWA